MGTHLVVSVVLQLLQLLQLSTHGGRLLLLLLLVGKQLGALSRPALHTT